MIRDDSRYPNDRWRDERPASARRESHRGYAEAMAAAYRQVLPEIPDDMLGLLAKLR